MDSVAKVGHVVLSLAVGGLEKMVCELIRSCRAHHMNSVIYCLDERGVLADQMEQLGIKVVLLKRRRGFDFRLLFSLASRFRQDGLTAVHTHNLDPMIYGGLAAWFAGIGRRIHTQHDVHVGTYSTQDRVKLVLSSLFIRTMVGVSSETARLLFASGVRPACCVTIANGVDLTTFGGKVSGNAEASSDGSAKNKHLLLGTVARLSPEKGLDCLIHAFALIHKESPITIYLEIAGEGGERKALEDQVERLGLASSVRFRGSLPRVDEFLMTLDIFVLPSLTEGIPLALLEAMASQLPVVGTRVGGVPEVVIHEESGILVPPNNPGELARAILDLVREPGKRKYLARNAQARIKEHFGLDTMVRRYRRLYLADLPEGWLIHVAKNIVRRLLPNRLILWRQRVERNIACITFDDGPDGIYTPQILDILRQFDVHATFFLIGNRIEANKTIVHRMVKEGHEVGNHSYSHPKIDQLSLAEAADEIVRTTAVIESCSGKPSRLFRPPEGKLCLGSIVGAWLNGQRIVMWNIDLKDCFATSTEDVDDALADATITPGDIILYHGDSVASLEALPRVLARMSRDGIKLVPLSELLGIR